MKEKHFNIRKLQYNQGSTEQDDEYNELHNELHTY